MYLFQRKIRYEIMKSNRESCIYECWIYSHENECFEKTKSCSSFTKFDSQFFYLKQKYQNLYIYFLPRPPKNPLCNARSKIVKRFAFIETSAATSVIIETSTVTSVIVETSYVTSVITSVIVITITVASITGRSTGETVSSKCFKSYYNIQINADADSKKHLLEPT